MSALADKYKEMTGLYWFDLDKVIEDADTIEKKKNLIKRLKWNVGLLFDTYILSNDKPYKEGHYKSLYDGSFSKFMEELENNILNVNTYINNDYDYVINNYPDMQYYNYYETHCTLNGYIDEVLEDAKVINYEQFTEIKDASNTEYVVSHKRDFINDTVNVEKVKSAWTGSITFDPHDIIIDFNTAVKKLIESNITLPHSNKMTFRCPMELERDIKYIFGTKPGPFVYVNAMTGEVGE